MTGDFYFMPGSRPTPVPSQLLSEYLGAGCGAPAPALFANSAPVSPNANFALRALAAPADAVVFAFAGQAANVPLGGGCTLFLEQTQLIATHLVLADASGVASWPLPIPPGLLLTDFAAQAFEVVTGGPIAGVIAGSNGLHLRAAGSGCP